MREIKFRGKRIDNNEWVYGYLQKQAVEGEEYYITWPCTELINNCRVVIPKTIGQFTGLYDKNNTPIFEGDIVSYNDFTSVYEYEITGSIIYSQDCKFEIEYDDKYIKFKKSTRPLVCNEHPIFASKKLEVIGNIYDNEVEE